MKSICVYCGSSVGNNKAYKQAAEDLGKLMADQNIRLVYGGAKIGSMGAVAQSCLINGGKVTGIIPKFLDQVEITNYDVTELIQTESMHERKTMMVEKSEGLIAMPGGFGTLEELSEVLTWSQLGLIKLPIGILNINGFYDRLIDLIKHMHQEGFLKDFHMSLFVVGASPEELLDKMKAFATQGTSFQDKLGLS